MSIGLLVLLWIASALAFVGFASAAPFMLERSDRCPHSSWGSTLSLMYFLIGMTFAICAFVAMLAIPASLAAIVWQLIHG